MKPKITCPKCGKQFTTAGMASHEVVHRRFISAEVLQSFKRNVVVRLRIKEMGQTRSHNEWYYQDTIGL